MGKNLLVFPIRPWQSSADTPRHPPFTVSERDIWPCVVINFLPLTGKELLSGVEWCRLWCTILGQVVNHFVTRREWWYTIDPYNYKMLLFVCLFSSMKVAEAILVLFCVTFVFFISDSAKWSIVLVVEFEWELSCAHCMHFVSKQRKSGLCSVAHLGTFNPVAIKQCW